MSEVKTNNYKKVIGIVANVLMWIFLVFSASIMVLVFASQGDKDGIPSVFGNSLITIESPSMTPTYKVGDLVFMEKLSDEEKLKLKKDDIITYRAPIDIDGDGQIGDINTHRIVSIEDGEIVTQGDKNYDADKYTIGYNDIIGKCTEEGKIGGLGNVIKFLRSSLGFFICIVLPLILFFIYELYRVISLIVAERAKKQGVSKETEEEIKRKAIEEYLKSQNADAEAQKVESVEQVENSATETKSEE